MEQNKACESSSNGNNQEWNSSHGFQSGRFTTKVMPFEEQLELYNSLKEEIHVAKKNDNAEFIPRLVTEANLRKFETVNRMFDDVLNGKTALENKVTLTIDDNGIESEETRALHRNYRKILSDPKCVKYFNHENRLTRFIKSRSSIANNEIKLVLNEIFEFVNSNDDDREYLEQNIRRIMEISEQFLQPESGSVILNYSNLPQNLHNFISLRSLSSNQMNPRVLLKTVVIDGLSIEYFLDGSRRNNYALYYYPTWLAYLSELNIRVKPLFDIVFHFISRGHRVVVCYPAYYKHFVTDGGMSKVDNPKVFELLVQLKVIRFLDTRQHDCWNLNVHVVYSSDQYEYEVNDLNNSSTLVYEDPESTTHHNKYQKNFEIIQHFFDANECVYLTKVAGPPSEKNEKIKLNEVEKVIIRPLFCRDFNGTGWSISYETLVKEDSHDEYIHIYDEKVVEKLMIIDNECESSINQLSLAEQIKLMHILSQLYPLDYTQKMSLKALTLLARAVGIQNITTGY